MVHLICSECGKPVDWKGQRKSTSAYVCKDCRRVSPLIIPAGTPYRCDVCRTEFMSTGQTCCIACINKPYQCMTCRLEFIRTDPTVVYCARCDALHKFHAAGVTK